MKWASLLVLMVVFGGCAHYFRDRQISSVDQKIEERHQQRTFAEPRGARY